MIIEIFLGFVTIVFAIAGAALVKFGRGGGSGSGESVNVDYVVKEAKAMDSKINSLTRLEPEAFNKYLGNLREQSKEKVGMFQKTSEYLKKLKEKISAKLYNQHVRNIGKYLMPNMRKEAYIDTAVEKLSALSAFDELQNAGKMSTAELKYLGGKAIYTVDAKKRAERAEQELNYALSRIQARNV